VIQTGNSRCNFSSRAQSTVAPEANGLSDFECRQLRGLWGLDILDQTNESNSPTSWARVAGRKTTQGLRGLALGICFRPLRGLTPWPAYFLSNLLTKGYNEV